MTDDVKYIRIRASEAGVGDVVTVKGARGKFTIHKLQAEGSIINAWGGPSPDRQSMRSFRTSRITSAKRPIKKETVDGKAG